MTANYRLIVPLNEAELKEVEFLCNLINESRIKVIKRALQLLYRHYDPKYRPTSSDWLHNQGYD